METIPFPASISKFPVFAHFVCDHWNKVKRMNMVSTSLVFGLTIIGFALFLIFFSWLLTICLRFWSWFIFGFGFVNYGISMVLLSRLHGCKNWSERSACDQRSNLGRPLFLVLIFFFSPSTCAQNPRSSDIVIIMNMKYKI